MSEISEVFKKEHLRIILTGDVSLNGYWATSDEFPFDDEVTQYIAKHDVVLINLESQHKGDHGENLLKKPRLYTSKQALLNLCRIHPNVCVLANNHVYDQLEDGFSKTIEATRSLGADIVGAGFSQSQSRKPVRLDVGPFRISVFAYLSKKTNPNIPTSAKVHVNLLESKHLISDIRSEAENDRFVIVSLHWGEDFSDYPTPEQRELAYKLIDAGANLIWGHHPHVVQGWETYRNTSIFYSLGNSIFDDTPGKYGKWNTKSRKGILVSINLKQDKLYSTEAISIYRETSRSQAHFAYGKKYEREISKLHSPLQRKNYQAFYNLYKLIRLLDRGVNYFFGPGRQPFEQLFLFPKRFVDYCRTELRR